LDPVLLLKIIKIKIKKRGPWSLEEDVILLKGILEKGKKWSEISKSLPGRTENSVKNRFNSLVKKAKHLKMDDTTSIATDLTSN